MCTYGTKLQLMHANVNGCNAVEFWILDVWLFYVSLSYIFAYHTCPYIKSFLLETYDLEDADDRFNKSHEALTINFIYVGSKHANYLHVFVI